jgi:hypothetical protein
MDTPEITPAPVSTIEELLGKIDMIHAAAQQWHESENGNDPDLINVLRVRVHELLGDITAVGVTPEQWSVIAAKCDEISELFKGRLLTTLNNAYNQS